MYRCRYKSLSIYIYIIFFAVPVDWAVGWCGGGRQIAIAQIKTKWRCRHFHEPLYFPFFCFVCYMGAYIIPTTHDKINTPFLPHINRVIRTCFFCTQYFFLRHIHTTPSRRPFSVVFLFFLALFLFHTEKRNRALIY